MTSSIPLWRKIQRDNFTSLEKLCIFLDFTDELKSQLAFASKFALNLPQRLAEKIVKKTLHDPILRQFVPLKEENFLGEGFIKDPVGDCHAAVFPRCLKKYEGRVLLLTSGACAMHCRYCFRQNYTYSPFQTGFSQELNWIRQDSSIKEVILSGGDPLSLSNYQLKELLDELSTIEHVKRIRFHTRFPIGIPERIDEHFLSILEKCAVQIWFVIHCNHPRELDSDVVCALKKIQKLAIPVLNQSVLLKGVNDSIDTLQTLCEQLVDCGVIPYYLHQLDRVEKASHFEVGPDRGRQLIVELNKKMAGYGVPKYVQEIQGESSKTLII